MSRGDGVTFFALPLRSTVNTVSGYELANDVVFTKILDCMPNWEVTRGEIDIVDLIFKALACNMR